VYKRVDTCAAEFASSTAYLYSTYEEECEAANPPTPKDHGLGGGPNRIGQGIEFDYCCVHAAFAHARRRLRDHHGQLQPGDRLHRLRHLRPALLRAADAEDVLEIVDKERPFGVIVQYGGQTPLKLAGIWRPPACPSSAPRRTPSIAPKTASASSS
jgi:carbamoyl-phosphate synthase large subunit